MYNSSTSNPYYSTVVANADSVTLSSSVSTGPITLTSAMTLTADVVPTAGDSSYTPSGTVDFFDGSILIGSESINTEDSEAVLQLPSGLAGIPGVVPGASTRRRIYLGDAASSFGFAQIATLLDPATGAPLSTVISPIASGDLVTVQVGDGFTPLSANTAPVFIDEINDGTDAIIQRLALPQEDISSTVHALTVQGTDSYEGLGQLSTNGLYFTVAGYDQPVGQAGASSTNAIEDRTVAVLQLSTGIVDTSTELMLSGTASERETTDVVSPDGNTFYVVGGNSNTQDIGMYEVPYGASNPSQSTPVLVAGSGAFDFNAVNIANNTLFADTPYINQSFVSVATPSGGLPPTGQLPLPNSDENSVPGLASGTAIGGGVGQFVFLNSTTGFSGTPNLLYVADSYNGLIKFYYSTSTNTWVQSGYVTSFHSAGTGYGLDGLSATLNANGSITLFATNTNGNASDIIEFTDPDASITATTGITYSIIAPQATNSTYQGLAQAPAASTPAPTVSSVVVNPNLSNLGNSRVLSIVVNFSEPVDISSLANAFTLTNIGTPNGGVPNGYTLQSAPTTNTAIGIITVTPSGNGSTTTSVTLTFSNYSSTIGATVEGGSLSDGLWSLSVTGLTSSGVAMSSPYTTPAGSPILRLFGDFTGAGVVSSADLGPLGTTYGLQASSSAFLAAFDADGNGEIDSTDLGRFGQNFGLTI